MRNLFFLLLILPLTSCSKSELNWLILSPNNIEGLTNGDKVRFAGANATNFTNAPYTISSLNTGAGTFQVTEAGQTTAIAGDLDYINHGGNVANVQIFSLSHGIPTTTNVVFSAAVGAASANTEVETVGDQDTSTNNTFFVSAASVTANVTGNLSPFITNITSADGLTVKPGYLVDLSGATSLNGAVATLNGKQKWIRMSLKPGINAVSYTHLTLPTNREV